MLRALGWSIAVLLLGGVVAVCTTPALPTQTVLGQGAGPAEAVDQVEPGAPAVPGASAGPTGSQPSSAGREAPPSSVTGSPASTTRQDGGKSKSPEAKAATTAAPKPAAAAAPPRLQPSPGSYPLRISGSSSAGAVPSSGTLVVESRGGDQLHRTVGVPGDLVLVQRAHSAGVDLVSFSITAGPTTLSFRPPAPVPFIRTQPGSWGWSVQSTDRTVTLNHTASVTSAGPMSVSGAQVPTVRVERSFTVSGANVSGTVRLTSTVSLVDRLPLVQHQVINVTGKALGGLVSKSVVSDSTATLTSTSPR